MITHTLNFNFSDGGIPLQGTWTTTGDGGDPREIAVPGPSTNLHILIAFALAQLQSIFIMSTVDMTLKTNSSSVPQETFTLLANTPVVWKTGMAAIFLGDVTTMYVTSAGAVAGTLYLKPLIDATP